MMISLTPLILTLQVLAHLASAQQPTPYIPATHYSVSTVSTTSPTPSPTSTSNSTPFTLPTTRFFPSLDATFRFPNTAANEKEVSSVWLALTSVQSTWTQGSQYPGITAAVYQAAPTSARSSLSISGYNWDNIVQAPWYSSVDPSARGLVQVQEEALQKTFDGMVTNAEAASGGVSMRKSMGWGLWIGLVLGVMLVLSART